MLFFISDGISAYLKNNILHVLTLPLESARSA